jgi:hypothetical protein
MTMKSPGWAGTVGVDAPLFDVGVRPGCVAARRAGVILGLDTIGDEPRGAALFAGALFAGALFAGALFAVALTGALFAVALAVAFFAVAFFAVAFFAGTVPSTLT